MRAVLLSAALSTLFLSQSALAVSSAELYTTQGYQFGRFEARLQFAPGDGVVSSFFLWKDGSETTGTFWNELDFEKLGADCYLQTNAIYGRPIKNNEEKATLDFDICGQFHTYTYEWTPEYIAWLVDGVEIRRETGAIATAFAQNTADGMQLRFNVWPGDASFGGNFDPAILPVYQYINWVQYSSYENGTFQLQWRHDFTDATLPKGWTTGNWKSPKNLSTHSAKNVGIVDGNVAISLTADTALGIPSSAPSDTTDGQGGASATGGSSSTVAGAAGMNAGGMGSTTTAPTAGTSAVTQDGDSDDSGCSIAKDQPQDRRSAVGSLLAMFGLLAVLLRRRTEQRSL
jgi:hypothetical protein